MTETALSGVRVLTFGAFVAGNTVGTILGQLGAEVVKIEARSRPEVLRTPAYAIGPVITEPSGVTNTVMYAALARGARGLSLEMGMPEGRALFRRLVQVADVVIENFGPQVMERWDCSYDDLRNENPQLVMVSLSGYGRTGPRSGYLAYAKNISNFVGLSHAWGHGHGTHSDYITAEHAVVATMAALQRVASEGEGACIDVSQVDAMAAIMPELLLDPLVNRREVGPMGNQVAGSLLSGVWPASQPDTWLAVELEDLADWSALCGVMERPDLDTVDDEDVATKRASLETALAQWIAARTSHSGAHALQKHGIAAGVVQHSEDIWRDPQLRARDGFVVLDQTDLGPVAFARTPQRLSKTPGRDTRSGPRLGEHSDQTLRDWLGLDESQLAALHASGAVFQA